MQSSETSYADASKRLFSAIYGPSPAGKCYRVETSQNNRLYSDAKAYCELTPGRYLPSLPYSVITAADDVAAWEEINYACRKGFVY